MQHDRPRAEKRLIQSDPDDVFRRRLSIAALSAGNFVIGMGAFVVIGLVTPIADEFGVSPGRAGLLLTLYAIGYAICSPLLVAYTGRLSRRSVLVSALLLFAVASTWSALATNEASLWASRVLAAIGAGLYTPVAAGVAISASTPERRGRALAYVFFGLTLAQVLGVPAGSFVGYTYGWELAFVIVAALSGVAAVGVARGVPRDVAFQPNSLGTLGTALADWRSVLSVCFTATFLGAIYVLYTYLQPLVEDTLGFGRDGVTAILLVFGFGAVAGNLVGGWLNDRIGAYATLKLVTIGQILLMPLFSWLPFATPAVFALTLIWSMSGWSFLVAQQSRLVVQTPERQNVVLALNAAAVYIGTAIGSALGALVVGYLGLSALGAAAGGGAAIALAHLVLSQRAQAGSVRDAV